MHFSRIEKALIWAVFCGATVALYHASKTVTINYGWLGIGVWLAVCFAIAAAMDFSASRRRLNRVDVDSESGNECINALQGRERPLLSPRRRH